MPWDREKGVEHNEPPFSQLWWCGMRVTGWGSENPMETILSPWQQTLCVGTRGSWQDSPCSATPGELWCCLLPGLDHQECQQQQLLQLLQAMVCVQGSELPAKGNDVDTPWKWLFCGFLWFMPWL